MKKVPLFSFTKFMAQLFLAHLFPFWLKSSPESWELAYSRTPLFKKQHWGEFSHSSPSNFVRGNSLSIPNLKNLHFFNQNGDYPLVFPNIAIAGKIPIFNGKYLFTSGPFSSQLSAMLIYQGAILFWEHTWIKFLGNPCGFSESIWDLVDPHLQDIQPARLTLLKPIEKQMTA